MKKLSKAACIYMGIIVAVTFVPIVATAIYSFNASEYISRWDGFTFDWYIEALNDKALMTSILNSVILGILTCVFALVIGTLGALGMKRTRSKKIRRLNGFISIVSSLPIMIPEIILGIVYLTVFTMLNLPFGLITLTIAHTTFCVPYVFMLVSERLSSIDISIQESARDLGASETRVFFDITLPMIMPAIRSGLILSFAMSFDDVIISVFVNGANVSTLPIQLYTRLKTGLSPEINAIATILIAIVAIAILLSNLVGPIKRKLGL